LTVLNSQDKEIFSSKKRFIAAPSLADVTGDGYFRPTAIKTAHAGEIAPEDILIFPNPSSKVIYIYIYISGDFDEAKLINQLGEIIQVTQLSPMNVSTVPAGVYLLQLKKGNATINKKLLCTQNN
jgi:hypothetical protein